MLHFDIDIKDLMAVGDELQATPQQVRFALTRALNRTASVLRTMSTKGLRDKLQLRRVGMLRKRLKSIRIRQKDGGVALWYGLNDMPISWFRGTPKENATGATFRGHSFPGGFVARSRYSRNKTILKRKGRARLKIEEQLLPVEDQAATYIEDNIFDKLEEIFWPIFRRDLQARVSYNIGGK